MKRLNKKRIIIVFLGLPASGKGTQVEILARKIGAEIVSTGKLIRQEIEESDLNDPFVKSIKTRYDKGDPQPDELVADLVRKKIKSLWGNIIFDNYPFSINQTKMFFEILKEKKIDNPVLIIIDINPGTSIVRATKRKICADCKTIYIDSSNEICDKCGGALLSRSDDNIETVKRRLREYLPRIKEVENEFRKSFKVLVIDGEPNINNVEKEIENELIKIYSKK